MSIRTKDRGLIYLRRSGDRQETSLQKQLEWALTAARQCGVQLEATLADLEHMQAAGLHAYKSLRLDDAITGSELNRPGLGALVEDALRDKAVSHVFAFKRNRLGRPNSPVDMMQVEDKLQGKGITLVLSEGIIEPSASGVPCIAQQIKALVDYHRSGEDLRDLSEQMIRTQLQLARQGFWVGGNAPYGFVRALVNEQGDVLEILPKNKRVRQSGCHVVIMPQDEEKLAVWLHMLALCEQGWGCKRIARHLNELGIPSPAAGATRKDHGVRHLVSGKWSPTTVRSLCSNRAIVGLFDYGRRSEGKHCRLGDGAPRYLEESDWNALGRPKKILNDPSLVITTPLKDGPRFDPQRWEQLQQQAQQRARSQRGVPRSRDLNRYPLSCRVVDLSDGCGALMYGRIAGGRLLYTCGCYMRTGGAECNSNSIDAEGLFHFTLATLTELVDRLGARDKLRDMLLQRAKAEPDKQKGQPFCEHYSRLQTKVATLDKQLAAARRNLATEEDTELREEIRSEFRRIQAELTAAQKELQAAQALTASTTTASAEEEVDAALALLDDIRQLADDPKAREAIRPLLERLGVRIGLRFVSATKGEKRSVRRLAGGIMAFGNRPLVGLDPSKEHQQKLGGQPDCRLDSATATATECKFGEGRPKTEMAFGGDFSPRKANRPETCPQEGVSITKDSRGDRRWTFLNDPIGMGLFQLAIAQVEEFQADTFFALGAPSICG